jgi:hypothetical protein
VWTGKKGSWLCYSNVFHSEIMKEASQLEHLWKVSVSISKEVLVCFFVQTLVCTFHCTGIALISVLVVNTDCAFGRWAVLPLSQRKLLPSLSGLKWVSVYIGRLSLRPHMGKSSWGVLQLSPVHWLCWPARPCISSTPQVGLTDSLPVQSCVA